MQDAVVVGAYFYIYMWCKKGIGVFEGGTGCAVLICWSPEWPNYTFESFLVNRKPYSKMLFKNKLDYKRKRNCLEHSF